MQTKKAKPGQESVFLVSDRCFPQTLDVLRGRAEPLDIRLEIGDPATFTDEQLTQAFGLLLQYPDDRGAVARSAAGHRAGARRRRAGRGGDATCWR